MTLIQQNPRIAAVMASFQAKCIFGCSQTEGNANGGNVTNMSTMNEVLKYQGSVWFGPAGRMGGAECFDPSRNSMQCLHLIASSWISSAQ